MAQQRLRAPENQRESFASRATTAEAETDTAVEQRYDLTPHQRILVETQRSAVVPRELLFTTRWTVRGALDYERFRSAWAACARANPILRTAFRLESTGYLQVVRTDVTLDWEFRDLLDFRSVGQRRRALDDFVAATLDGGMDAERPPLFRVRLARVGTRIHELAVVWHHGIMDLWLVLQLMHDVLRRYEAGDGTSYAPDIQPRPFRDYVDWIRVQAVSDDAIGFWRSHLRFPPRERTQAVGHIPFRWTAPGMPVRRPSRRRRTCTQLVDPDIVSRVLRFGRDHALTIGTVAYGAWSAVQCQYQGAPDALFATTVSGRSAELDGAESVRGPLFSTQPFLITTDRDETVPEWLRRVQADHASIQRFDYLGQEQIERWCGRLPAIWSVLIFQNMPQAFWQLRTRGIQLRNFRADVWLRRPVTVFMFPGVSSFRIQLIHDPQLVTPAEADWMLRAFTTAFELISGGAAPRPADIVRALPVFKGPVATT